MEIGPFEMLELAPTMFMSQSRIEELLRHPMIQMGHDAGPAIAAKALCRVPWSNLTQAMAQVQFLMPTADYADFLSPALRRDSYLIVLGTDLIEEPTEKQVEIVLPLVASALLKLRHPQESPVPTGEEIDFIDPISGTPNIYLMNKMLEQTRDEAQNLKIDVHFGKKRAADLVAKWLEMWDRCGRPADGWGLEKLRMA